jgi:gliding motility-associated-like protein
MKKLYARYLQYIFFLSFLINVLFVSAQNNTVIHLPVLPKYNINPATQSCATDVLLNALRRDPKFRKHEDDMNKQILSVSGTLGGDSYIVPVVFHIINPDPASITDAQVIADLNNLNDAFGKKGAYAASTGADTKIQFCLAQKGPDGGSTTGITRTASAFWGFNVNAPIEDDRMKNLNRWDPSRYINIWIVSSTNFEGVTNFLCGQWTRLGESGYAYFPGTSPLIDGIVLSGVTPGPGLAHEMGHYFSLYHTFEGLNCANNNCETDGDHVCDTPPDASVGNSPSCNNPENSCTTDTLSNHSNGFFPTDVPDMISNFMDYANDVCHNAFTEGQAERMRAALTTQRSGLLQNECVKPCAENSVAYFTRDAQQPVPGDIVNFTNTSTGAVNYQWLVNNVAVSTSPDYTTSFPANGTYQVTLKAYNNDATCYSSYSDFVIVTCGVVARFYTDKTTIASKALLYVDSINFTNNSVNATSYKWLLSYNNGPEQLVSTDVNYKYVFPNPGTYTMRLIASSGNCSDTTETYYIPVADPTQDGFLIFNDVQCYEQTKIRVAVQYYNEGFATMPANMPVTFYDADPRTGNAHKLGTTFFFPDAVTGHCWSNSFPFILDITTPGLNQVWAVFNDSGTTKPFSLPGTNIQEPDYLNNFAFTSGFQFHIAVSPASATLQPGDTLQLITIITPSTTNISSFVWSSVQDINCTNCSSPYFIAEKKIYTDTKQLIATSSYGCVDTAYTQIQVPAYDDFVITIDSVACAGKDSLHIGFTICNNFKRGTIPQGLQVSFYDNDPTTATANLLAPLFTTPAANAAKCASYGQFLKRTTTGKVFAVVNDNGTAIPLQLPENNIFIESLYTNNISSINYIPFTVSATPATATLEPGDTLGLRANAGPDSVFSYLWSTPHDISCTNCDSTVFIAEKKDITKQVIVTNDYGCADTTSIIIHIPPADDYTITIDSIECYRNDSLLVGFTLCNSFKRGIIPQGLQVSFFDANPSSASAHILGPVFTTGADVLAKCASYTFVIKGISGGNIYAAVNNNARSIPLIFPDDTLYLEKDYTNNIISYAYLPDTISLQPNDTTIFRKQTIPLIINTTVYDPSSTAWFTGSGYTLSCSGCISPLVTVTDNSIVTMQTANRYGCLIKGKSIINIFSPDMVAQIIQTNCFTNNTTRVKFTICMNNGYDSIFKNIPVSFYDGNPLTGSARLLEPTFYTQKISPVPCDTFVCVINSPLTGNLYAVVNDNGDNTSVIPDKAFDETNYINDTSSQPIIPFVTAINPGDTTIFRQTSVQIMASATGGQISSFIWEPVEFLSCSNCLTPVVTPPYSMKYAFIAQNEYACLDTVYADVKTFAAGKVDIPNAFSPNGDGHNDIFYILGNRDIKLIRDFAVYTRLGEKVFEVTNVPANDPAYGWNGLLKGKQAPAGSYVYYATIFFNDGTTELYKGSVIVLR